MNSINNIMYHYLDRNPEIREDKTSLWLNDVAREEGNDITEVNFVFCSDEYLLEINVEHLNRDYLTDVISFYYNDEPGEIYGDVFISIDRVKENAESYDIEFRDEMDRIIIHGFLHLIGYSDSSKSEKALMTEKENLYLKKRV